MIIVVSLLVGNASAVGITDVFKSECRAMKGTVWATDSSYDRDTEVFNAGDMVYIAGNNFKNGNTALTGQVKWTITIDDHKTIIASGTADLDAETNPYPFSAKSSYIVPKAIWKVDPAYANKELRLNVWHTSWENTCSKPEGRFKTSKDSFDTDTEIPEFPTLALPIAATIGILYIVNRKKQKKN